VREGRAAFEVGGGIVGGELDRLVEIGDGENIILPVQPNVAAVVIIVGVLRIEPDRVAVIGQRVQIILLVDPDIAAVE